MEVVSVLIGLILLLWWIWRKQHLSTFKNLGIPGPEPGLLFGNMIELYFKGPLKCHEEWVRKYGRVLGFFYGMQPVLLITDPSLLKNIFIKDFPKFMNRESFNPIFKYNPHNKFGQSVLTLQGKRWKEVRSVLTPTFTSAKMKQMAGSINSSIEDMVNIMKERAEAGTVFDIEDTYKRVTMDVITKTAFGVRMDFHRNPNSEVLRATKILFSTTFRDPIIFVGLCFPYLNWLCRKAENVLFWVLNKGIRPETILRGGLLKVLQHRRANPMGTKCDLLQLMIDTRIYADTKVDMKHFEIGNAESEKHISQEGDSDRSYRKMEDYEIISSAVTVLLAGYETTSTALAFTTYLLAKYQDVQEKLFQEIQELVKNDEKLEYATVNKLQYLDKVFNESMRIYPPVYSFTNRYAMEDVEYGEIKIPKDMLIQAPVYLLHHDPDFWEDPEKFDPERFHIQPNGNGITYMPFGVGPRNCLGMRFAQLEAKLVLAHVLSNFRIIPAEDHLDTILRIRTISPKNGIRVKLQLRVQDPS